MLRVQKVSVLANRSWSHGIDGAKLYSKSDAEDPALIIAERSPLRYLDQDLRYIVAVLIPRIRTLGVRLSEEEYLTLEKFSIESGARSMSDLARTAIRDFIHHTTHDRPSVAAFDKHTALVRALEQRVSQLTAEIALLKEHKESNTP